MLTPNRFFDRESKDIVPELDRLSNTQGPGGHDIYVPMLMKHYQNCLEARLALWLKEPPLVTLTGQTLVVEGSPPLELEFLAEQCRWRLNSNQGCLDEGSFDSVTKTGRKLWSGVLSEEEAASLTRSLARMVSLERPESPGDY